MQMTSPNIDPYAGDATAAKASDNLTPRTEPAPTPNRPIPYPEWPAVVESLINVFARLDAARRPAQGVSAQIVPADGPPPATAALTDKEAVLVGMACRERPGVSRMDHSLNGLLEAVMALHLSAVLRHNRQVRQDGLSQSLEGGQAV